MIALGLPGALTALTLLIVFPMGLMLVEPAVRRFSRWWRWSDLGTWLRSRLRRLPRTTPGARAFGRAPGVHEDSP